MFCFGGHSMLPSQYAAMASPAEALRPPRLTLAQALALTLTQPLTLTLTQALTLTLPSALTLRGA